MNLRVNSDRLWQTIEEMGEIGATPGGGCNRQALTDEDRLGRDLFRRWCEEAGCTLQVDTMGNMFARRAGSHDDLPAVATGSHLDTQPGGGRFDGVLGVLAGLEVLRTLNDHGIVTRHAIEVVNWTNEEGSRFGPPTMASAVYAGEMTQERAYAVTDAAGARFGDELERIGYKGELPCTPRDWHAFFELHIEQGPVLEAAGTSIGVVGAAQGSRWFTCHTRGQSSHAGTTPMPLRKDALVCAAELVLRIRDAALAHAPQGVATVGRLQARPGSPNVVPGSVDFSIDLRHPDIEHMEAMTTRIQAACDELHAAGEVSVKLEQVFHSDPVRFEPGCIAAVRRAAQALGLSHMDMVSGATHDALHVAPSAPTAMIFVPSRGGLSHNEREWTEPQQCTAGADVLLHALLDSAGHGA